LRGPPYGGQIVMLVGMTHAPIFLGIEHPARALGWLDLLAALMPGTVHLEVSGFLVVALLVALWILRGPPGGGRPRK
jgi:hypothetical protein